MAVTLNDTLTVKREFKPDGLVCTIELPLPGN